MIKLIRIINSIKQKFTNYLTSRNKILYEYIHTFDFKEEYYRLCYHPRFAVILFYTLYIISRVNMVYCTEEYEVLGYYEITRPDRDPIKLPASYPIPANLAKNTDNAHYWKNIYDYINQKHAVNDILQQKPGFPHLTEKEILEQIKIIKARIAYHNQCVEEQKKMLEILEKERSKQLDIEEVEKQAMALKAQVHEKPVQPMESTVPPIDKKVAIRNIVSQSPQRQELAKVIVNLEILEKNASSLSHEQLSIKVRNVLNTFLHPYHHTPYSIYADDLIHSKVYKEIIKPLEEVYYVTKSRALEEFLVIYMQQGIVNHIYSSEVSYTPDMVHEIATNGCLKYRRHLRETVAHNTT